MRLIISSLCLMVCFFVGSFAFQEEEYSLRTLTPENYHYREAERCSNCKDPQNAFMPRAAGVDLSSGKPVPDQRGWLASVHARSQSHEDRINTACAWCHAPTTQGATKDEQAAKPIPKGTWQGVTCGACHPGSVPQSKRISLLSNFEPGTDPANPDNYIFRDRKSGNDFNALCRYCHHESHDLLIKAKQEMTAKGDMRCIDCHMAAYADSYGHIERFHNFKVEANLPYSCSGGLGRAAACHADKDNEWFSGSIKKIKGPEKEWIPD